MKRQGGRKTKREKTERLVTFLQQKGTSTSPHRRLLIQPTKYKPGETRTNRQKPHRRGEPQTDNTKKHRRKMNKHR
jgi:hypothetical protein